MKSSLNKKVTVVGLILCAGQGARTGLSYNKILHPIGKTTVLETTLDAFIQSNCTSLLIVCSKNDLADIKALTKEYKNLSYCIGGDTRVESVKNGLAAIKKCDIVVIHDGARPFVSPAVINNSIDSALKYGSGIVAFPTTDSIRKVQDGEIIESIPRDNLYNVQTPQSFRYDEIKAVYDNITAKNLTDDSEVYLALGKNPKIVLGEDTNRKITTISDFALPKHTPLKIGIGYDVHKLVENRPLILGGVTIPHDKGLLGHSDADVLTHAIMDALLSAADLPDIGILFPDTDNKYKGANSIELLKEVITQVKEKGYQIQNVSAVIMAQRPKLASFLPEIKKCLADTLDISLDKINISATTTEGLGIVGKEQGMAASASCLLSS